MDESYYDSTVRVCTLWVKDMSYRRDIPYMCSSSFDPKNISVMAECFVRAAEYADQDHERDLRADSNLATIAYMLFAERAPSKKELEALVEG